MRNTLIKTTAMPLMLAAALCPTLTFGQSDPFYGQLMLTAGTYCPNGWLEANGQLLSISQNQLLFSILGTNYGGNGTSVFGLPDLRGRTPIHVGQGPGLNNNIDLGESGGAESVTLMVSNLPVHSHSFNIPATTNAATHSTPASGRVVAQSQNAGVYADAAGVNTSAGSGTTGNTGSFQPVQIRNPYLGMRWCIANTGAYPTR